MNWLSRNALGSLVLQRRFYKEEEEEEGVGVEERLAGTDDHK
jgi:hypothetical protein